MKISVDRDMKYAKLLIFLLLFAMSGCDEQTIYSAFPPEGYFDPILTVELEPGVLNYSGETIHKYSGDYSISLIKRIQSERAMDYPLCI